MGHVEKLAERILFLKGEVQMKATAVQRIVDPVEILAKAAEMEKQSALDYNKAARKCAANADAATKQIFESLVADEEQHFAEFDKQLEHSRRFGPTYLMLQSLGTEIPAPGAD